ncbi:hypothetical protein ACFS5J_12360 [Flavobacterium chuncheonense]|uniref:Uncharacterized protein n=1 Tax=Flavobacterium chuncheonense TaxID=2026653 RepID=A0ABW5YP55_9FLAO
MKKILFLFISFYFGNSSLLGQNITKIDSLGTEMCQSLSKVNNMKTKEKIEFVFQSHLSAYFDKTKISSQREADSISTLIYYRLQKNCSVFLDMLGELEENKSDWQTLNIKPSSKISKIDYKSFLKGGNYYYKDYNGSIVNVHITEKTWSETFDDGTISKLTLISKSDGEFDLKFIESNNETRKNLSVKGDIYKYGIYEKNSDGFLIWTSTNDNQFLGFKLYKKS